MARCSAGCGVATGSLAPCSSHRSPSPAWHLVIVLATLRVTSVAVHPLTAALGIIVAFAAVGTGGLLFAVLRARTGRLAAPIAAHAAFNAAILLGLGL